MNKLLLINPAHEGLPGMSGQRWQRHPPLSLATVAGYVPKDWDVTIHDEAWSKVAGFEGYDEIGVTAFTSQANRAYEILDAARSVGIPTSMGGIHAWACTDEASQHAKWVIRGEIEGDRPIRFSLPRYDLLDPRYEMGTVQLARGCPRKCLFCSVSAFSGTEVRRAPIEDVLLNLSRIHQDKVFIVDDNLSGATETLRAIATSGINKHYAGQCDVEALGDNTFLSAAEAAGVKLLLVGIETEDFTKSKGFDITLAHGHGIAVLGAFIFGFDRDTPEKMLTRAHWIVESGCDCVQVSMLTPLPGTRLYEQLNKAGRIIDRDWSHYDFGQLVHVPRLFSSRDEFYAIMEPCSEIVYNAVKEMAGKCMKEAGHEAGTWAFATGTAYSEIAAGRVEAWKSGSSNLK